MGKQKKTNPIKIKEGNWNTGIITIDDVWDDLLARGIINMSERIKMKWLNHIEQQKELIKYKTLRRKHF